MLTRQVLHEFGPLGEAYELIKATVTLKALPPNKPKTRFVGTRLHCLASTSEMLCVSKLARADCLLPTNVS